MNAELRRKAKEQRWDSRFLNGHPDVIPALRPFIMRAVAMGLVVTSTTGGRHSATSFHYRKDSQGRGHAVDIGRSTFNAWTWAQLVRFQRWAHTKHGRKLAELFGPSNYANRKWGNPLRLAEGSGLESLHDNHVHIAVA